MMACVVSQLFYNARYQMVLCKYLVVEYDQECSSSIIALAG